MKMNLPWWSVVASLLVGACGVLVDTEEVMAPREPLAWSPGGGGSVTYEPTIAALLAGACGACHDAANALGGIDISSIEAMVSAGVVVPGDPEGSLLFDTMASGRMPPPGTEPLTPEEIDTVRAWIAAGAP